MDGKGAVIVPVYKWKGRRGKRGNFRGICLLSIPGTEYEKVIIERVQRLPQEKIGEEQGSFRKERACVDQTFSSRMVIGKILPKGQKLDTAFIDLEKLMTELIDWN